MPAGASIAAPSASGERPAKSSRHPESFASEAGGRPSSVIPDSPSWRPTPPVSTQHGIDLASGPEVANRPSGAASSTGIRRRRSSPHDEVPRHGVGGAVTLARAERRPVGLGEEREPEADDEERRGRDRVARVAAEREDSEAEAERRPPAERRCVSRSASRNAGRRSLAAATAAAKVTSAGRSSTRSPSVSPRRSESTTRSAAATAARSRGVTGARPSRGGPDVAVAASTAVPPSATRATSSRPVPERTLWPSTSPAGAPARSATKAPAASPSTKPSAVPAIAITPVSTAVSSTSCHRRAPDQASRRRAARRSRRSVIAARIAKAKRSAAASPPTSASRCPARRLSS